MGQIPTSLRPVLTRLQQALRAQFGTRLRDVRLFGSFAQGQADEDSDVDVLVVIDALTDDELALVTAVSAKLSVETGFDLAPLPLSTERHHELLSSGAGIVAEVERTGARL